MTSTVLLFLDIAGPADVDEKTFPKLEEMSQSDKTKFPPELENFSFYMDKSSWRQQPGSMPNLELYTKKAACSIVVKIPEQSVEGFYISLKQKQYVYNEIVRFNIDSPVVANFSNKTFKPMPY